MWGLGTAGIKAVPLWWRDRYCTGPGWFIRLSAGIEVQIVSCNSQSWSIICTVPRISLLIQLSAFHSKGILLRSKVLTTIERKRKWTFYFYSCSSAAVSTWLKLTMSSMDRNTLFLLKIVEFFYNNYCPIRWIQKSNLLLSCQPLWLLYQRLKGVNIILWVSMHLCEAFNGSQFMYGWLCPIYLIHPIRPESWKSWWTKPWCEQFIFRQPNELRAQISWQQSEDTFLLCKNSEFRDKSKVKSLQCIFLIKYYMGLESR